MSWFYLFSKIKDKK